MAAHRKPMPSKLLGSPLGLRAFLPRWLVRIVRQQPSRARARPALPVHPPQPPAGSGNAHPPGLLLLFLVEMWERFSYYGMRALLVLYLTTPLSGMNPATSGMPPGFNPGLGWPDADAATLYGWYTGLAYLLPVPGGLVADRLLGRQRSMVAGGILIALGHLVLAASGLGRLAHEPAGATAFIGGLALIVLGTGCFKPTVSVMVGELYPPGDARREGGFTLFYLGINLGAFLCAFVCGTVGQNVGWHWGFGSAAVGMVAGLTLFLAGRGRWLRGVGQPPAGRRVGVAPVAATAAILACAAAAAWHIGFFGVVARVLTGEFAIAAAVLAVAAAALLVISRPRADRGPVASILLFTLFAVFFWIAYEQTGSSINLFTERNTDRTVPAWLGRAAALPPHPALWFAVAAVGFVVLFVADLGWRRAGQNAPVLPRRRWTIAALAGFAIALVATLKGAGVLAPIAHLGQWPTPWFQSVNPLLIIVLAPLFADLWTALGRRGICPSQSVRIAAGLILLGIGYVVITVGAAGVAAGGALASAGVLVGTYLFHTLGELCLSPTGLSYTTRVAPAKLVSLLTGVYFLSSFVAGVGGGLLAAQTQAVASGRVRLPWHFGGQADYFFLFVVTSIGMGLVVLALSPFLNRLDPERREPASGVEALPAAETANAGTGTAHR